MADPIEPLDDPEIDPALDPAPEPDPDPAPEPKPAELTPEQKRVAFELRQTQKREEALKKELEGYKRRDEEKRKAEMSEQQKLQEERDALVRERDELRLDNMRAKIGAELKLPATLIARLQGTDEEAMRADAEDLAKLIPRPRVGSVTDPARGSGTQKIYTRAELAADPKLAASPEVRQAALEGRIK